MARIDKPECSVEVRERRKETADEYAVAITLFGHSRPRFSRLCCPMLECDRSPHCVLRVPKLLFCFFFIPPATCLAFMKPELLFCRCRIRENSTNWIGFHCSISKSSGNPGNSKVIGYFICSYNNKYYNSCFLISHSTTRDIYA